MQMKQQFNRQKNLERIAKLKRLEKILIITFILVCALLSFFLL